MPAILFNDSLKAMAERDPAIATDMLENSVNAMLAGDLDDGRILLRDYVNATIGFKELAARTGKIDKNLMRALGPKGSPTAANLFEIIRACIDAEGLTLAARVTPAQEQAPVLL